MLHFCWAYTLSKLLLHRAVANELINNAHKVIVCDATIVIVLYLELLG